MYQQNTQIMYQTVFLSIDPFKGDLVAYWLAVGIITFLHETGRDL